MFTDFVHIIGNNTHTDEGHWSGQERFPGKIRPFSSLLQGQPRWQVCFMSADYMLC